VVRRAALWFTAARLLIALRITIWCGSAVWITWRRVVWGVAWRVSLGWLIGAAVAALMAVLPVYWD